MYELDKVARHIGFTVNQSMSPVEAISAAKAEIKMYFHENTPGPESNMDKIFMSTLLSPQQLSTLLSINEAFYTVSKKLFLSSIVFLSNYLETLLP